MSYGAWICNCLRKCFGDSCPDCGAIRDQEPKPTIQRYHGDTDRCLGCGKSLAGATHCYECGYTVPGTNPSS